MSDSQVNTGEVTVEKDHTQMEEKDPNAEVEKKDPLEAIVDGFKYILDFYNKKQVIKKVF